MDVRQPAPAPSRWPRFIPGPAYDHALAKERMMGPALGGRSKKAQLGSIEESWGPLPQSAAEDRERCEGFKGMFELEEDPPSRNVSPFRESAAEVLERSLDEAWRRARRGTGYIPDGIDHQQGGGESHAKRSGSVKCEREHEVEQTRMERELLGQQRRGEDEVDIKANYRYDHYDEWEYSHQRGIIPLSRGLEIWTARHIAAADGGWDDDDHYTHASRLDFQSRQTGPVDPEPRYLSELAYDTGSTSTAQQTLPLQGVSHSHSNRDYRSHERGDYARDASHRLSQADEYRAWLRRSNGGMKKRDRWRDSDS
ncbi:hypothetical protein I316_04547 [Kwoniella heveanensis BCC8398]|uniref:Uncharacterized protein n=1 Tax=Kwoniella heveanensis BCC8398 TaxID=1296120 RepID=A0A1B9GSK5_9TREE|nr:hypothetical protein I316_04547 [Kwoniella heveanensis BCC8398]